MKHSVEGQFIVEASYNTPVEGTLMDIGWKGVRRKRGRKQGHIFKYFPYKYVCMLILIVALERVYYSQEGLGQVNVQQSVLSRKVNSQKSVDLLLFPPHTPCHIPYYVPPLLDKTSLEMAILMLYVWVRVLFCVQPNETGRYCVQCGPLVPKISCHEIQYLVNLKHQHQKMRKRRNWKVHP